MERRRHRRSGARGRTEQPRKLGNSYRQILSELYPEPEFEYDRPRTRADCLKTPRPCPFVSCRYHLYLDVGTGKRSIKFNFPDKEPWEVSPSCALDLTDAPMTLDDVGDCMNLTRERVRQIEEECLRRLQVEAPEVAVAAGLADEFDEQGPLDPSEAEMEVLKAARRLAEIEREEDELRAEMERLERERRRIVAQIGSVAEKALRAAERAPRPVRKPETAPEARKDAPKDVDAWILSILRGGQLVPTRRLSSTLPSHLADGDDPSRVVAKAIQRLAKAGRIVNGKAEGKSRSWRLSTA